MKLTITLPSLAFWHRTQAMQCDVQAAGQDWAQEHNQGAVAGSARRRAKELRAKAQFHREAAQLIESKITFPMFRDHAL